MATAPQRADAIAMTTAKNPAERFLSENFPTALAKMAPPTPISTQIHQVNSGRSNGRLYAARASILIMDGPEDTTFAATR